MKTQLIENKITNQLKFERLSLRNIVKISEFYNGAISDPKFHELFHQRFLELKWNNWRYYRGQAVLLLSAIPFVKKMLKKMPFTTHFLFSVALSNSKAVGICFLTVKNNEGAYAVAVHPKYQGLGIGTKLSYDIFVQAKEEGIRKIRLGVYQNNLKAVNLYKKIGFKIIKKHAKGDFWNGKYIPMYSMEKVM